MKTILYTSIFLLSILIVYVVFFTSVIDNMLKKMFSKTPEDISSNFEAVKEIAISKKDKMTKELYQIEEDKKLLESIVKTIDNPKRRTKTKTNNE